MLPQSWLDWAQATGACDKGIRAAGEAESLTDLHIAYRLWAAIQPGCPPDLLAALAQDPDADVRRAVMRHPAATPAILRRGAQDPKWYVRLAVMRHPRATPAILAIGVADPDERVRRVALARQAAS